jgi:hypothetical protein
MEVAGQGVGLAFLLTADTSSQEIVRGWQEAVADEREIQDPADAITPAPAADRLLDELEAWLAELEQFRLWWGDRPLPADLRQELAGLIHDRLGPLAGAYEDSARQLWRQWQPRGEPTRSTLARVGERRWSLVPTGFTAIQAYLLAPWLWPQMLGALGMSYGLSRGQAGYEQAVADPGSGFADAARAGRVRQLMGRLAELLPGGAPVDSRRRTRGVADYEAHRRRAVRAGAGTMVGSVPAAALLAAKSLLPGPLIPVVTVAPISAVMIPAFAAYAVGRSGLERWRSWSFERTTQRAEWAAGHGSQLRANLAGWPADPADPAVLERQALATLQELAGRLDALPLPPAARPGGSGTGTAVTGTTYSREHHLPRSARGAAIAGGAGLRPGDRVGAAGEVVANDDLGDGRWRLVVRTPDGIQLSADVRTGSTGELDALAPDTQGRPMAGYRVIAGSLIAAVRGQVRVELILWDQSPPDQVRESLAHEFGELAARHRSGRRRLGQVLAGKGRNRLAAMVSDTDPAELAPHSGSAAELAHAIGQAHQLLDFVARQLAAGFARVRDGGAEVLDAPRLDAAGVDDQMDRRRRGFALAEDDPRAVGRWTAAREHLPAVYQPLVDRLEQGDGAAALGFGPDGTVLPGDLPADLVPLVLDYYARSLDARTEPFSETGELVTFYSGDQVVVRAVQSSGDERDRHLTTLDLDQARELARLLAGDPAAEPDRLAGLLRKVSPVPTVSRAWIRLPDDLLARLEPGQQVDAPTLSTRDTSPAEPVGSGNVLLTIAARYGRDVTAFLGPAAPARIAYPPGTRLAVADLAQDPVGGDWEVRAEQVGTAHDPASPGTVGRGWRGQLAHWLGRRPPEPEPVDGFGDLREVLDYLNRLANADAPPPTATQLAGEVAARADAWVPELAVVLADPERADGAALANQIVASVGTMERAGGVLPPLLQDLVIAVLRSGPEVSEAMAGLGVHPPPAGSWIDLTTRALRPEPAGWLGELAARPAWQVAWVWDRLLSPAQRWQVIHYHRELVGRHHDLGQPVPNLIGNLDGLPSEVRRRANRAVLDAELARPAPVARHSGLEQLARWLDDDDDRMLLGLDVANGYVIAATSDPDTASYVAAFVPGGSANLAATGVDAIRVHLRRLRRLAGDAAHADPVRRTAAVLLLGHDTPPESMWRNPARWQLPRTVYRGYALGMAAPIRRSLATLRVTSGGALLTVIGHSLGAAGVGAAASGGLPTAQGGMSADAGGVRADRLVFLGAPGIMVHEVQELQFDGDPERDVYEATGRRDPILLVQGIVTGRAPVDAGARSLPAGPSTDHSGYFRRRNPVRGAIALVVTGQAPPPEPATGADPEPEPATGADPEPEPPPAADEELADQVRSGVAQVTRLSLAGGDLVTERVRFHSGGHAIRKLPDWSLVRDQSDLDNVEELLDAEELAAGYGRGIGVLVPDTYRAGPHELFLAELGDPAADLPGAAQAELADSDEAVLVGFFDLVVGVVDRDSGNWRFTDQDRIADRHIVAIDHASGFRYPARPAFPPDRSRSPFQRHFLTEDREWTSHDLTPHDVALARAVLVGMREEFATRGRLGWYESALARLDALAAHATGTRGKVFPLQLRRLLWWVQWRLSGPVAPLSVPALSQEVEAELARLGLRGPDAAQRWEEARRAVPDRVALLDNLRPPDWPERLAGFVAGDPSGLAGWFAGRTEPEPGGRLRSRLTGHHDDAGAVQPPDWLVDRFRRHRPAAPPLKVALTTRLTGLNSSLARHAQAGDGWSGGATMYGRSLGRGRYLWYASEVVVGGVDPDWSRAPGAAVEPNSLLVRRHEPGRLPSFEDRVPGMPDRVLTPPDAGTRDRPHYRPGGSHLSADALQLLVSWRPAAFGQVWTRNVLVRLDPDDLRVLGTHSLPSGAGVDWTPWLEPYRGHVYIYGVEDRGHRRYLHVARVAGDDLRADWWFFDGSGWSRRPHDSARILTGVAARFSVTRWRDRFLLITHDPAAPLRDEIVARVAASPTGPFTPTLRVYRTPEQFTHNALEHPDLRSGDRLVIGYSVGEPDQPGDVRGYQPRFIDVHLAPDGRRWAR